MAQTTREERREQVELYLQSSMTQKQWCDEHGISERTLGRWLSEYDGGREEEAGGPAGGWVSLGGGDPGAACPPALTVRVGGVEVVVPHGADQADVACVLRAARGL